MSRMVKTAGIDVSKATLDLAIWIPHVPNTRAGWTVLAAKLAAAEVKRVGLEAKGGYERGAAANLRHCDVTVVLLQPAQVTTYGKLHLRREGGLDRCRPDRGLHRSAGPGRADGAGHLFEALGGQLTFIEQIEEDIARYRMCLEHITDKQIRRNVEASIRRKGLRRLVEIKRLLLAVRAYPHLGDRTALALLIRMPELGHLSCRQAASLAGLAPFVRQSGLRQRQAKIGGGSVASSGCSSRQRSPARTTGTRR